MGVRNRTFAAGLIALTIAWGSVLVSTGPNQNAHLARVTAFAHGTPHIDRYHNWTLDTAYVDGHFYAAKAPGLAIATLPWYFGLRATGLLVHGPPPAVPWPTAEYQRMPRTALWEVSLWGALLPFVGLLVLVRWAAELLVPGFGNITAITLGAGSLIAVFATLFFDHELSALLGFLAFSLLLRERSKRNRRLVAAAGIAAGLGATVEFPVALIAVVLGIYALGDSDRVRRGLAYIAGLTLGVLPLVAYSVWAFGTIFPRDYSYAVITPGKSGHDVIGANSSGFFGISVPKPAVLTQLLLSPKGLLILAPVWTVAALGLVLLWRAGKRAEAATAAGIVAVFLLYNAGYYNPFGGFTVGPRFLVPILPFLALGLAAAWRAYPGPTLALACTSVTLTTVSILANPMLTSAGVAEMFHRLESGANSNGAVPWTVLHWIWHAPVAPLLLVGLVVAATVTAFFVPFARRLITRDVVLGVSALIAWRIVYVSGTVLVAAGHAWIAAAALALTLVAALALLVRGEYATAFPAIVLAVLIWPGYADHTSIAVATIGLVLLAMVIVAVGLPRRASSFPRDPAR